MKLNAVVMFMKLTMQYFKLEKLHLMIKIIFNEVLISNLTVVKLLDQKKGLEREELSNSL